MVVKLKKPKLLTPIQKVRKELEEQKVKTEDIRGVAARIDEKYRNTFAILLVIRDLLAPEREPYQVRSTGDIPVDQLPFKVHALLQYKHRNEGSIVPEREQISNLMEIIRWHSNPAAALEQKTETRIVNGEAPRHRCECGKYH